MTWLVIDAGNSRIKWRLGQGAEWFDQGAFDHDYILSEAPWPRCKPQQIVIAQVWGKEAQDYWRNHCQHHWHQQPLLITAKHQQYGLTTAYQHPQRLGADRYAALIACQGLGLGACGVVGCGTAITMDWLTAHSHHEGGLIWPGLSTMNHALSARARQLPRVALGYDDNLAAITTEQGIQQGLYLATSHAIRGIFVAKQQLTKTPLTLVLTGGDGAMMAHALKDLNPDYRPHLVLEGLQRLAQSAGGNGGHPIVLGQQ